MDKNKTAPVAGAVGKKYEPCGATEIDVSAYSRIVFFHDESTFLAFLEGNKHLVPLYGLREYEKQLFPNLFVAAIRPRKS